MNEKTKRVKTLIAGVYSNVITFIINIIAYAITLADAVNGAELKAFVVTVILSSIPILMNILNVFVIGEGINNIKRVVYIITAPLLISYIVSAIILLYINALNIIFYISIVIGAFPIGEAAFNAIDSYIELKSIR